jgi:endonuclease/exonuclease/phosphatase family metal-dependent hydrolase
VDAPCHIRPSVPTAIRSAITQLLLPTHLMPSIRSSFIAFNVIFQMRTVPVWAIILVFAAVCVGESFPYSSPEGQIRIVSWNIEKLGDREPPRTPEQLSLLAQRMLTFDAAIFALQEIYVGSVLDTVRSHMGPSWKAYYGGVEYAFLYDETKVELLSAEVIIRLSNPPFTVYPRSDFKNVRVPITGVFRPVGGAGPFRVIVDHFTGVPYISEEGTWVRLKIIEYLEDVYETDEIFLMGDYNGSPGTAPCNELHEGDILSTLPKENGNNTSAIGNFPIDWFDVTKAAKERVPKQSTFVIRPQYYGETDAEFEATYSDHFPVFADIKISFSTQNGPIENVNNGSRYDHFRHAIIEAQPGDLIVAAPRTYNENVNLKGKSIILSSTNPDNPDIVGATVLAGHPAVTFSSGEGPNCKLIGFTVTDANTGIYCFDSSPSILNCRIVGNRGAGIELHNGSDPVIGYCEILCNAGCGIEMFPNRAGLRVIYDRPAMNHCIIAGNQLHGLSNGIPQVTNCTIAANGSRGIFGGVAMVVNSIVYFNSLDSDNVQIECDSAAVSYTDVQGNWAGQGNIDEDPLFAAVGYWETNGTPVDPDDDYWLVGDYHLKSRAGRWHPGSQTWVHDSITSPCIDAGSPDSECLLEPLPNGGRIDMGAYGGTPQASMSWGIL